MTLLAGEGAEALRVTCRRFHSNSIEQRDWDLLPGVSSILAQAASKPACKEPCLTQERAQK